MLVSMNLVVQSHGSEPEPWFRSSESAYQRNIAIGYLEDTCGTHTKLLHSILFWFGLVPATCSVHSAGVSTEQSLRVATPMQLAEKLFLPKRQNLGVSE